MTAVDGTPMIGTVNAHARLPRMSSDHLTEEDARSRRNDVVVTWEPVTEPSGNEMGGYQVLVVQEEPVLRTFSADLPANATRIAIPAAFLQRGVEYKVELLAGLGGNRTLTELSFRVA